MPSVQSEGDGLSPQESVPSAARSTRRRWLAGFGAALIFLYPIVLHLLTGPTGALRTGGGEASRAVHSAPHELVSASLDHFNAGRFEDCLRATTKALRLDPESATAYNNAAACHTALHQYDEAVRAARQALRLRPDFRLARNNLEWALARLREEGGAG